MFNLILIVLDVLVFPLFWTIRINIESYANFLDKQPFYFERICKQLFIRLQIRQICVDFVYDWHIIKYSFQPWLDYFIFTFFRLNALLLSFNMYAFGALFHVNWAAKSYILQLKRIAVVLKSHFSCLMIACLLPLSIVNFSRLEVFKCCFRGIIWLKISTFFKVMMTFLAFRNDVEVRIITPLTIYWCLFSIISSFYLFITL